MPNTAFPPSIWRLPVAHDVATHRPADSSRWTIVKGWFSAPPSPGSVWHVGAVVDVDVDPGVVGELRLRSSRGSFSWPAAVEEYTERIILGWEPVEETPQRVWLEARRRSGPPGGAVKVVHAEAALMQVPPAAQIPGPTYGPGATIPAPVGTASSFHAWWDPVPTDVVEATVEFELITVPVVAEIYYWALQVDFADAAGTRLGAGHAGLMWNPAHPDTRAINWGGYETATGDLLDGTVSALPSTPGNANTRDFPWVIGRRYRLRIYRSPAAHSPRGWRFEITDTVTSAVTVVRDLYGGGDYLASPVVWSEVFAASGAPSSQVRWSTPQLQRESGEIVAPATAYLTYQSPDNYGHSNTNQVMDATGLLQTTNTTRVNGPGARLPWPGDIESPVITAGQSFSVPAGSANGTTVGTVLAYDNVGVSGFSIVAGNTGGAFTISATGVISVANSAAVTGAFTLSIQAADAAGNTATGNVTVTASTAGDITPPVIPAGQSITVSSDAPNSTLVGNITATDNVGVVFMDITAGNTGGAFYLAPDGGLWVNSQAAVAALPRPHTITVIARDAATNETSQTVAINVIPTSTLVYAWEDRPPYIEPNPNATAGSPQKLKATELGITSRISVSSVSAFNSAKAAATPGTQIYVTANLVGNGASQVLSYYSNKSGAGAGTSLALVGGGSDPDGTASNPIMITCAPGVWIDGGLADGAEDLNSRCITIRGAAHVWLYGANVRRANFIAKYDQCPGDPAAPIRVWYCNFQYSGHAALHLGGYHTKQGNRIGETNNVDIRYNEISYTGRGQRRFGEAIYIGYGSGTSYLTSQCHGIVAEANLLHHVTAEAFDAKPGCYDLKFNYNLVRDCDDGLNIGNANEGFPGSVQFLPGSDSIYPSYDLPGSYNANCEAIGNRFFRITSASQKYPTAQILIAHRGVKVIGNYFVGCAVPGSPQIRTYIEDGQSFGTTGTIEIHNNTSKDSRALWDHFIGGGSNPTQSSNANSNTNASNNVGTSSQTGVNLVVSAAAFGDDGTGYEGSAGAPAPGGPLDVTGSNTSAQWSADYAGQPVVVPVKPGAHQ